MLRTEQIRLSRPARDGTKAPILHGITVTIPPGRLTAIVGPSGSGKSSFIRLLNRLEEPSSGTVYLDDTPVTTFDPLELRRRVGMVPQKPFMFDGTVLDNLQIPFLYRREPPPAADAALLRDLLAQVQIRPELLQREARTLSIGEQQRVSLARALVVNPQVLLLDEPTSALDRPTADRLGQTLREVCRTRQLTAVMVTHDLQVAQRSSDYLIYLEAGQVMEEGPTGHLLGSPQTPHLRRFLAPEREER